VAERLAADGSRVSQYTFLYDPSTQQNVAVPVGFGPAADGLYLTLYGTGLRGANTAGTRATVDGLPIPVIYAGPQPEFAGLDQVNLGPLPRSLAGRGEVPVAVEVDGRASNVLTVTFGN
jgi:uncharacterized protein (TIGR03437 family)